MNWTRAAATALLVLAPTVLAAAAPEPTPGVEPAPPAEPTASGESATSTDPIRASNGADAPPPGGVQTSSLYPTPGTPPPGLHPIPAVPESEYLRHAVELVPELGLAWPICRSGRVSSNSCNGVEPGLGAGVSALWRVLPYFAWGGSLDVSLFRYDPSPSLGRDQASAAAVSLLLLARGYFLPERSVEPYVELGLGGSALGTAFDEATSDGSERYEETGAGPAVLLGAGVDLFLGRRLRLGPYVTFTQVSVDKIRRCRGGGEGDCVDLSRDDYGYLGAYFLMGARLTVALGDEL